MIAAHAAAEKLAEDIVALDVSETLVITDVFLLCSASNDRQVRAIVDGIEEALDGGRNEEVRTLLGGLSAAGQADVLEQIAEPHRDALVALTKRDLDPETLAELDEDVRDDVLDEFTTRDLAAQDYGVVLVGGAVDLEVRRLEDLEIEVGEGSHAPQHR